MLPPFYSSGNWDSETLWLGKCHTVNKWEARIWTWNSDAKSIAISVISSPLHVRQIPVPNFFVTILIYLKIEFTKSS